MPSVRKKISGIDEFAMISEELLPVLNGTFGRGAARHVGGYCGFIDGEAKFDQFAVDSWRAPIIFCRHFNDQVSKLLTDSRATRFSFGSRNDPPK